MKLSIVSTFSLMMLFSVAVGQTTSVFVPNGTISASTNVIPFGTGATFQTGYTYVSTIPAALLAPANATRRVQEIFFAPASLGSWSSANIQIGLGHVANPQPCPFFFPTFGMTPTIGSFLDFTVIWDSAVNGTFNWNLTAIDMWNPMGFAAGGGTPFIWDGVNDIGFFVTYSNSTIAGGFGGGFRASAVVPPGRTYATGYQAATSTACNATAALYLRLDMIPSTGAFANFGATPQTGAGPLAVNFTDNSTTSSPGGITSWAWDVQNDGIIDYTVQSPTHIYTCPGSFSVALTVNDGVFPPATIVRTNFIGVNNPTFSMTTTGGGVGNLTVNPVSTACFPTATHGYTLLSISTTGTVGGGPLGGLYPDSFTFLSLTIPPSPGYPLHFTNSPGLYPNAGSLILPPGFFPAGITLDALEVLLTSTFGIVFLSNVARVTF